MVDESESVDIAVVVDVLRVTSVMTTALESGANQIYTCCEISEAKTCLIGLPEQMVREKPRCAVNGNAEPSKVLTLGTRQLSTFQRETFSTRSLG